MLVAACQTLPLAIACRSRLFVYIFLYSRHGQSRCLYAALALGSNNTWVLVLRVPRLCVCIYTQRSWISQFNMCIVHAVTWDVYMFMKTFVIQRSSHRGKVSWCEYVS